MSRLLFIEVVVQAHVDEASNVCCCLQMHHLPSRCIYLVWSSIFELHRQREIFDHQHVPHLWLPYWVVGAGELEHAAEWIFHFLSYSKFTASLWYQIVRNSARPQPRSNDKWKKYRQEYVLYTYTKRRHQMLTWKPKLGKNHGSPQTLNSPLWDGSYNEGVGGNALVLYLFANMQLQKKDVLYLTPTTYCIHKPSDCSDIRYLCHLSFVRLSLRTLFPGQFAVGR